MVAGVEEEHVDAGREPFATTCGSTASAIEQATARVPGKVRAAQAATSSAVASGPSSRAPCLGERAQLVGAARGGAARSWVRGAGAGHRSSSSSSARWAQLENVSPASRWSSAAAHDALDVVGQVVGGDLQAAHGAAEAGLVAVGGGEAAAEVHLEAGLLLAVGR